MSKEEGGRGRERDSWREWGERGRGMVCTSSLAVLCLVRSGASEYG